MFSEPATVPVVPVITQPAAMPTYPASTAAPSYNPPSYPNTGAAAGGYGSSNSFNSQPPRQYGNDENMKKQVSERVCLCVCQTLSIALREFSVRCVSLCIDQYKI